MSTLENLHTTFATVFESNIGAKLSLSGFLLNGNLYHFPNSGNHLHNCLGILFQVAHGNHMEQCYQMMPLEMDNQL